MHPSVTCCFQLWLAGKSSPRQHMKVHAVCGKSFHSDSIILPKMMQAWLSWVSLVGVYELRALDSRVLADLSNADYVLVVVQDADERERAASALGIFHHKLLWPDYPPVGSWDNDALREVAHHDYELGGFNEWDGAPVRHSSVVLRRLSLVHCQQEFPAWVFNPEEAPTHLTGPRRPLEVLDLGCGPVSLLRWGMINGSMRVSGVDPLLPMYELILARHGLDVLEGMKLYRSFSSTGEEMNSCVPADEFDVVYTNNALDHCQNPELVVRNVARSLKSGGRFIVGVATQEGTRQNWDQFHKTDIWLESNKALYCHQDKRARLLIPDDCNLEIREIIRSDTDALVFVAARC